MLMDGGAISQLGLWMFDLSVTQQVQFQIQIVASLEEYRTHCIIIQSIVVLYEYNHHKTEENTKVYDAGGELIRQKVKVVYLDGEIEKLEPKKEKWEASKEKREKGIGFLNLANKERHFNQRDNNSKGSKSSDEISTKAKEL
ncbi:hypothetical protein C5167_049146 [Papaver somniferum]|uniref:Uncharacterized protein n=1 Tax=Papaver somniferum TaxID=3469 RepID=A0A4Y7KLC8_PAPSO|nr:hypothetical protein C5167_049146 [Papaver somniferum]